jgi:hypothetical protein
MRLQRSRYASRSIFDMPVVNLDPVKIAESVTLSDFPEVIPFESRYHP